MSTKAARSAAKVFSLDEATLIAEAVAALNSGRYGRRAKYGNRRVNGYASAKEAKRAAELKLLEKAGKIRNLREQVRYEVIPPQPWERGCYYVADFVYEEKGATVVEDCKGYRTPEYKIKRKLMLLVHGIRIRET